MVPSTTKPKREKCELVTSAVPIYVADKVEQIAVAIANDGRSQIDVTRRKGNVLRATLDLGAPSVTTTSKDWSGSHTLMAPVFVGAELSTVGVFPAKVPEPTLPDGGAVSWYVRDALPFVFEKGSARLSTTIVHDVDTPGM